MKPFEQEFTFDERLQESAAMMANYPARIPIPLGLVQGRVTHIIWPPSRTGRVERKIPEGEFHLIDLTP